MHYEEDIAFQRAILANPADATLKLVYSDWLQERNDPRAEYVRAQVEGRALPEGEFDPAWLAFMTTLAQPFEPGLCAAGDPFGDRVGMRGKVNVFESQYRKAGELTDGLLADLTFLTSVEWGRSYYHCLDGGELHGFVCALRANVAPLTDADVRIALGNPMRGRLTQKCREQDVFEKTTENSGVHGRLKRYVAGRQMWYFATKLDRSVSANFFVARHVALAVGRSPHGNRLVGVLTYLVLTD